MKLTVKDLRKTIAEALEEMKLGVTGNPGAGLGQLHVSDERDEDDTDLPGEPDPVEIQQVKMLLRRINQQSFDPGDDYRARDAEWKSTGVDFSGWAPADRSKKG